MKRITFILALMLTTVTTYSVTSIGEAAFELNLDEYIDNPDSWLDNE